MEPIFAVRMVYDEEMFYHQYMASKPKEPVKEEKKTRIPKIHPFDFLLVIAMFAAFFLAFPALPMVQRIVQSLLAAALAFYILKRLNRAGEAKQDAKKAEELSREQDLHQARALLENSCLAGVACNLRFFEDSFQVENPEITTEYLYEGVAWIKETSKYFVIFWNRSLAIPVEKAGFYRGKKEQFGPFIGKKCGKTIEKVRLSS